MTELATFGAGCFWHLEAAFQTLPGITRTAVGYTGGHFPDPCYLDVLARITGHAEAVQIEYEPEQISYLALLDHFWRSHDPTLLNRQGPDRGEQYRSVIFYHTSEQEQAARRSRQARERSGEYDRPIVTQIEPASTFYRASEEHQQYFAKRQARSAGDR